MSADPGLVQLLMGGQQQNPVVAQLAQQGWSFADMMKAMNLTPQEQFLYQYHLRNLLGSGKVRQDDGRWSTVLQETVERDGRVYNIPTVWNGKILDPKAAMAEAAKAGWDKWPSYANEKEAEDRYSKMHDFMEKDVNTWQSRQKPFSPIGYDVALTNEAESALKQGDVVVQPNKYWPSLLEPRALPPRSAGGDIGIYAGKKPVEERMQSGGDYVVRQAPPPSSLPTQMPSVSPNSYQRLMDVIIKGGRDNI